MLCDEQALFYLLSSFSSLLLISFITFQYAAESNAPIRRLLPISFFEFSISDKY